MKVLKEIMVVVVAVAFIGGAMASPSGKTVEYAGGAAGKVTFDGKVHADKGLKCNDCHTKIFQMKKDSTKITMTTMNKGENCGTCHNGDKAFKSSDPKTCKTCHKK